MLKNLPVPLGGEEKQKFEIFLDASWKEGTIILLVPEEIFGEEARSNNSG